MKLKSDFEDFHIC